MKKFVQISNNKAMAIRVIPGIYSINKTNLASPIKDRLNVQPAWGKFIVMLMPGVGWYPAEIAKWDSVRSLAKSHVLTIGSETDGEDIPEEWKTKAEEMRKKLDNATKKYEADVAMNEEIKKADAKRPLNADVEG